MDWFERLTGFGETTYEATRSQLRLNGEQLNSTASPNHFGCGVFELVSLGMLRARVAALSRHASPTRVRVVQGDVRRMHREPENARALFQVASQFNMLEMVGPEVTPEQGVTRYAFDRTQGPACAMAAGAATIYRNYLVPVIGVDGQTQQGQTQARQLNGLSAMGEALSGLLGLPVSALWDMRNGYALCHQKGLDAITGYLEAAGPQARHALSGHLHLGLHQDAEVTDGDETPRPTVSQIFCSALPVSYSAVPSAHWQAFAQLVLDAAYEATLLAGVLNAQRGASNVVLLTRLGGGAFGNSDHWIDSAIRRALLLVAAQGLEVKLVSYGPPSQEMLQLQTL